MLAQALAQSREVVSDADFALRLGVALGLGAVIGIERQWRQGFAGVRTYALVSAGAALFVLFSLKVGDPSQTRVAAQVVSGIGFLGAGVIMRDGASVRGLTTAAGLWCSAAVGVLAAGGYFPGAAMGAVAILAANILLRPVKQAIDKHGINGMFETLDADTYLLRVTCRTKKELAVRSLIMTTANDSRCRVVSLMGVPSSTPSRVEIQAEIEGLDEDENSVHHVLSRLSLDPAVLGVAIEVVGELEEDELELVVEEEEEEEEAGDVSANPDNSSDSSEDDEVDYEPDRRANRKRSKKSR
jgi:putative Mg2+ transporter-C (MgtC) family protein